MFAFKFKHKGRHFKILFISMKFTEVLPVFKERFSLSNNSVPKGIDYF